MRSPTDRCKGQAAVEAAFLLPVLLVVLGLMVQPSLMLYNRCVMCAAAYEGCRMLQTGTLDTVASRAYIVRRLSAVPHADAFHCGGDEGWEVSMEGGGSGPAKVKIGNRLRPLPLFGVSAGLFAAMQGDGTVKQEVTAAGELWPAWAQVSGGDPAGLAGEWE